jgi:protein involved in polysaccharide export with SLBB domain
MRVFVPQEAPRRFAVAGGVHKPGLFPMPPDPTQKVYLTDAIAQAEGPVERAKTKQIALFRKNSKGGPPEIVNVDFNALQKKRDTAANLEIHEGDVVIIDVEPDKRDKRTFLERVAGIAAAFVSF